MKTLGITFVLLVMIGCGIEMETLSLNELPEENTASESFNAFEYFRAQM